MAKDSPHAELLKKKPLFIGNLDLVEIYHDRLEIFGWAWDRRFPTGKSEALVLLGSQLLGIAKGTGQRADLREVGLGTAGVFHLSCARHNISPHDLTKLRLVSFDGKNAWEQNSLQLKHVDSKAEYIAEDIELSSKKAPIPLAAFSLKTDPLVPYYAEVLLFSSLKLDAARLRVSVNEGNFVSWTNLGSPWVHPERGEFPSIRLLQIPLPQTVLDGEGHNIRFDLMAESKLVEGLKTILTFPIAEPLTQKFYRQQKLIRGYNLELNKAEHSLAQSEKTFRKTELEFSESKAESENTIATLRKELAVNKNALASLKKELAQRQNKIDELVSWQEQETQTQKRLLKILEAS